MATYRGCFGVLQAGPTPVTIAEVNSFNFDATAAEIDTTSMGDCTSTSIAGSIKTTGSMDLSWDPDDPGQSLFVVGETLNLEVNPAGLTAGVKYANPAVLILSQSVTSSTEDVVKTSYTYSLNGAWTESNN